MKVHFGAVMFCGVLAAALMDIGYAQNGWLKGGGNFIDPIPLPLELAASLHAMGDRMTAANLARVTLAGTLTDSRGSRPAQVIVQAPGYLRYEDSEKRVLIFDGSQFTSQNGKGADDDERIMESLLAHLPDNIFLQMAAGGGVRHIGSHFRIDDGRTPHYEGPYWSIYAFVPMERKGLSRGKALQQDVLISVDEQSRLMSEVRVIVGAGTNNQKVTQTRFNSWQQQAGQWFPGEIIRIESGQRVLIFSVQQTSAGAQGDVASLIRP